MPKKTNYLETRPLFDHTRNKKIRAVIFISGYQTSETLQHKGKLKESTTLRG